MARCLADLDDLGPYHVVSFGRVRGIFFGWHHVEARSPEYPIEHFLQGYRGVHYYETFSTLLSAERELVLSGSCRQLGLHTPERNRGSRYRYYAVAIGRATAIVFTHQECRALRRGTRSRVRGFNDIYEAELWIFNEWAEEGLDMHGIGEAGYLNGYARQRSVDRI